MSQLEDLLRQTFAERERDMDEVELVAAPRRRSRRTGVVLAGAAAAAVVLIGTTVAVDGHRSTADAPVGAASLRYAPAPVVSSGNRTTAVLTWAPTWTPAAETGREVTPTMQSRFYGFADGRFAAVTVAHGNCRSLERTDEDTDRSRAVTNARGPHAATLCRELPGGGALDVRIDGATAPAAEARRVADSVRTGRRDEVALPVSLPAGTVVETLSVTAPWTARSRWDGKVATAGGAFVYLAPPDFALPTNQTVAGRRANVHVAAGWTDIWFDLSPSLRVHLQSRDRTEAVGLATALHLGPLPDYSWLGR